MASCLNSFLLGSKDRISQHIKVIKYFSKPDLNYRINISKPQTNKMLLVYVQDLIDGGKIRKS